MKRRILALRFTQITGGPHKPAHQPGFFIFGLLGKYAVDMAASHRKSLAVTPQVPACKSVDRSCGKTGGRLFISRVKRDPHHVHPTTTTPAPAGHHRATSALSSQVAPDPETPGTSRAQARPANPSYAAQRVAVTFPSPPFLFVHHPADRRGVIALPHGTYPYN
jgi:hypothetical protein